MAETGNDINKAAALLKAGKLVAIPTETVYGLAANALDEKAVARIFSAKNRPFFDPLIVHIASSAEVEKYASAFPDAARRLAKAFWPGPLTLVLPKRSIIPDIVSAGHPTVGLRVPNHPVTRELLTRLAFPLAAPSANPFGYVSPTTAAHVEAQLGDKIDYILDGGPCTVGLESTIISFANSENPAILRLGGLAVEKIVGVTGKMREMLHQNSDPSAPGQLDQHYAPGCRLLPLTRESLKNISAADKVALVKYREKQSGFSEKDQFILSEDGSLESAATRLFSVLRELDSQEYTIALVEDAPDEGLGRAINDRLRRAGTR